MPVIVEDGTNVAGANSAVDEDRFIDFADARGVTVAPDKASQHLVIAMDAIGMLERQMPGERTFEDQALCFPRTDFYIDNRDFANDAMPEELKIAQLHAALASYNGIKLMPVYENGKVLIKKKTGPIEKEWAYDSGKSTTPEIPQFQYYMSLIASEFTGGLTVRRV